MLGKLRQKEKRAAEDETAGWHRRLDGTNSARFREVVRDGEAWRTAVHGLAEDTTERLSSTLLK